MSRWQAFILFGFLLPITALIAAPFVAVLFMLPFLIGYWHAGGMPSFWWAVPQSLWLFSLIGLLFAYALGDRPR